MTHQTNTKTMDRLFQGKLILESTIPGQLGLNQKEVFGMGFLDGFIVIWQNPRTKKTIITGREGHRICVKICEGNSFEDAMLKLDGKCKAKDVFTDFGLSYHAIIRQVIENVCLNKPQDFCPVNLRFLKKFEELRELLKIDSKTKLGAIDKIFLEFQ